MEEESKEKVVGAAKEVEEGEAEVEEEEEEEAEEAAVGGERRSKSPGLNLSPAL